MTYPVCVVIPTIDSRWRFLTERCLPSVRAASPAQVVVVFGDGNGNEKRNAGARAATQPYLLFVDDDSEVSADILKDMIQALEFYPDASFAYANYRILNEMDHVKYGNEVHPGKWNFERLRSDNYIDTTSLIRREVFPGFDPEIRRFQDWDLWLTMASKGLRGKYVPKCLFDKLVIDENISMKIPEAEAREAIKRKHYL